MRRKSKTFCRLENLELRQLLSTIYVSSAVPGTVTKNGNSWATAYTDLQQALGKAAPGDSIEVGKGIYFPSATMDRTASFQLKDGVAVRGGYAGYGAGNPDDRQPSVYTTTLSGDLGNDSDVTNNSYHVVNASGTGSTAVLDGFTLTGGNANDTNGEGGGIVDYGGSPEINDCTITGNTAGWGGGGLYAINNAPTLNNCTISGNSAGTSGGGMYIRYATFNMSGCTVSQNTTPGNGGGLLTQEVDMTFTNCDFVDNSSTYNGGGIFDGGDSTLTMTGSTLMGNSGSVGGGIYNTDASPTLINCNITGNVAGIFGGGIANYDSTSSSLYQCKIENNSARNGGGISDYGSSPVLLDCIITGNQAADNGALYDNYNSSAQLVNCLIAGNTGVFGAAVGVYDSSTTSLINCTITGNVTQQNGGVIQSSYGGDPTILNSILWGNTTPGGSVIFTTDGGTATVKYSDVEGGYAGTGNININPLFVDSLSQNFQIRPNSPAVDAGSNAAVPGGAEYLLDLKGANRFQNVPTSAHSGSGTIPLVDMGAYEATAGLAASAGGAYALIASQSISLHAAGSSNVAGSLTYGWEINNDGHFNDLTGANPVFNSAGYPVNTPIPIAVKVTDASHNSVIDSTTITIVSPTIYVDASATGANNGTSWANALMDLSQALNLAISGVTIDVAQGTYFPTADTGRMATFALKPGVTLDGGFAGDTTVNPSARDPVAYATILSGDIGVAGDSSDNSYHVVTVLGAGAPATLDGVSVQYGQAGYSGSYFTSNDNGGGVFNAANLVISNSTVSGNYAANRGAGVYNYYGSTLLMTNSYVTDNSAYYTGGGVDAENAIITISHSTLTGNSADFGGALYADDGSTVDISNSTVSYNSAFGGGGIQIYDYDTKIVVTNSQFYANSGGYDGAISNFGELTISGSTLSSNTAEHDAGAIGNHGMMTMTDCTISGNTSQGAAGGIDTAAFAGSYLYGSIITENTAAYGGGGMSVTGGYAYVYNSQITHNQANYGGGVYSSGGGAVVISNSTIADNTALESGGGIDFVGEVLAASTITGRDHDLRPAHSATIETNAAFIVDSTVSGNTATYGGGVSNSGDMIISYSTISNNTAYGQPATFSPGFGGGFDNGYNGNLNIDACTITGNSADIGGGGYNYADLTITNTSMYANAAVKYNGGALANAGVFTISNSTITGNTAATDGGAISNYSGSGYLYDSQIDGNIAINEGGGIAVQNGTVHVFDCILTGNTSADVGGAFNNGPDGTLNIYDSTITQNRALKYGGAVENEGNLTIANSILWQDSAFIADPEIGEGDTAIIGMTFTDIAGGYAGTGNIDSDPLFIRSPGPGTDGAWGTADDDYGDLHLQFVSPGIDAGSNAAVPPNITTDLDGNARFFDFPGAHDPGAIVDMGAYELGYNLDEIIVPAGEKLTLPAGGYPFSAKSLSIGTDGTLDITNDSLTLMYGANPDPISSIAFWLGKGYALGQWNGTGIISSTAGNDHTNTTGIGVFDIGSQLTIARTWNGDTNLDGKINADDISLMLLGQSQHGTRWQDGNFNYDMHVDADDWIKLMYALAYSKGQSVSPSFSSNSSVQNSDVSMMKSDTARPLGGVFAPLPIVMDDDLNNVLDTPQSVLQ